MILSVHAHEHPVKHASCVPGNLNGYLTCIYVCVGRGTWAEEGLRLIMKGDVGSAVLSLG